MGQRRRGEAGTGDHASGGPVDPPQEPAPARHVSPAWLWAARGAAALSLAVLGAWPLAAGLTAQEEIAVVFGGLLTLAYGLVLLLLGLRKPAWVFGAGLRLGALVGLVVLLTTLGVGHGLGSDLPVGVALGVAQLVLIVACVRLARSHAAHGRLLGYGLGFPIVLAIFLVAVGVAVRRHPPRHDSYAIGDLRSFASAQAYYESENGLYGTPRCLARPVECIPGYAAEAPAFFELDAPGVRSAYLRAFHPGPRGTLVAAAGVERAGFTSWALTAVPLRRGFRSFCVDASGTLVFRADGSVPLVEGGACTLGPGVDYLD
jgi:hypothetical protein